MQTTQHSSIHLRDPGDLIAAVPHILGYRPAESVVVCGHGGPSGKQIKVCARTDLPPPEVYWGLAEQLKTLLLRSNSTMVTVVVVTAEGEGPDQLPHVGLIQAITRVFASIDVRVDHALWIPEITTGTTWWCYGRPQCGGRLPDPTVSELAAVNAVEGSITHASRAELRACFEPGDAKAVARRTDRIVEALQQQPSEAYAMRIVDDVFADLEESVVVLDDDRVVDLAVALTHTRARDFCLAPERLAIGPKLEEMWTELIRETPVPYRAEPACMLAVTSFVHGNGVIAGVALEIAKESNPQHAIADMLRLAMDYGLAPKDLMRAVKNGLNEHTLLGPPE
jgi:hypothetical protein